MKKLVFALFFGSILLFSACNKDNDNDGGKLTGTTWTYNGATTSMEFNNSTANTLAKPMVDYINEMTNVPDPNNTMVFKADGTWEEKDSDGTYTGTYTVSGNKITVTDEDGSHVVTYSISNNILTFVLDATNDPEAIAEMAEFIDMLIAAGAPANTAITKLSSTATWKAK